MINKNYIVDYNVCGPDFMMGGGVKVKIVSMVDNYLEEVFGDNEYYMSLKVVIVEVIEGVNDLIKGDCGMFLFDDKKGIFVY